MKAFTTHGIISPLSHAIPVLVGIDTHAEVDLVDIKLVRQLGLKPCRNKDLPILRAVNQQNLPTYGAYNLRMELTDTYGTRRTTLRPYLAVDRDPEDAQVLLGMPALTELKILVDCESYQWQYRLEQTSIRIDTYQRFAKRAKRANVYALIEVNHLLRHESQPHMQAIELPACLRPFFDVFSAANAKKLAPHRDIDLAIELKPGTEPPYGPIYPLSPRELGALKEFLEENLAKGFIRESKSPAGAPILFTPKKDGGLRLCVDYRGLNAITIKNRYPLPLISEIMDRVSGANYFSKIDLKDAYYRLRIKPGDEWKTAFRTRYGHFEFLVVPMGLTNAPATFQAYINKALQGLVDDFCIVYLDDILIFSRTKEEHDEHLQRVCQRLREAELYAKPSKCQFYQEEIEFLGFIIGIQGIRMDPGRVQTIKDWENHPPKTYRDLQVLLGFCNFYRRFIKGYSAIARPLTSLLKGSISGRKSGNFSKVWGDPQQQAFLDLLGAFQKAPLLRHYHPDRPIRLEADASDVALGGVLSQLQTDTNKWHPIAFFSKQFKGAELNYATPDKELMAIVECFKHWRQYLEGISHTIEVWSDHMNLQGFMKQPRINGRQARWLIYLTPYDFIIRHRPGSMNPADGPSRRPDLTRPAGEIHSLVQTDLLASKLVGTDSNLPKAARPITEGLCDVAKCQLCVIAKAIPDFRLWDAERPKLDNTEARFEYDSTLCNTVRATRRVNAASPLGAKPRGRWDLDNRDAVGSRTPTRTVQVLCASPRAEDSETGHLIELVRLQAVTRREAKKATRDEDPLSQKTAPGLIDLILKSQGTDPLCIRLKKELRKGLGQEGSSQKPTGYEGLRQQPGSDQEGSSRLKADYEGTGRKGYTLDQKGLLSYQGRAVVPLQKALIQELLYLYHDDQLAGHWGVDKTKELLQRRFYWPGLTTDVREYVTTCPTCQNIAIPRHRPYGKLESLPVPERPWQEVSLDFITQLPSSYIGTTEYDAVLVVVDRYTKMAKFLPTTTNLAAPEFAALFHENIELKYGSPRGIISDRDTRITSKFWAEVCTYSLVKRRLSTAFHPQTDGQTEVLNRILENYLRAYTSLEQMNWAKLLSSAEFAYNNSRSSSTGLTPFKALYGYDPELRVDLPSAEDSTIGEAPAAYDRIQHLSELRECLQEQLLQSQERQAKYYNQRHQPKLFKRKDLVKLSTKHLRLKDKKLQPRWIGPFRVLERVGTQAYRLALPAKYD
jgi:hypothetical protein